MATALRDLHSLGIMHRDIKPGNLKFATSAPDAHVKVLLFSDNQGRKRRGVKVGRVYKTFARWGQGEKYCPPLAS